MLNTLDPAYNEFGFKDHPNLRSSFLCIRFTDSNVKKFSYNQQPLGTDSFFCIILLAVSGTQSLVKGPFWGYPSLRTPETGVPPRRIGVRPWTGYTAGGTPLAVTRKRTFLFRNLCDHFPQNKKWLLKTVVYIVEKNP